MLQWFPLVGIILGSQQLYYWLTPPKTKMHWWFEHLGGMMGCCIATITAFVVFGAPRLLHLDSVHPLIWFVPTIVLTPVIIGYATYYRRKFKNKTKSSEARCHLIENRNKTGKRRRGQCHRKRQTGGRLKNS